MKIVKRLAALFLLLGMGVSCNSGSKAAQEGEKYFEKLNDNQAIIIAKVDGKAFYPAESVFSGQIIMSGDVMNLTLADQFDGRTIINLAGAQWYTRRPVADHVARYDQSATSLKMGKIVDREKLIGEGYMLTRGDIAAVTFEKDKMIFEIKGEVAKYSDFQQPDKYLPFEGLIVYKKPAISLGDISEEAIFGSTHSN